MIILYTLFVAIGALPLTAFLLKRKRYYHILRHGIKTTAQVTNVKLVRYPKSATYDRVLFTYLPFGAVHFLEGQYITKVGRHKRGDKLEIFYLSGNPQKNAVPGSREELPTFIFLLLILLFVIFACFKIQEMVKDNVSYTVKPPWKQ